ncbi:hypothetical protein SAMN04487948_12626 [Halogranum amylolyticum]|uniref:Helix-turn-helix domain-containing protein n=1 Tax=Halogranum amylolyticum TaxID=660520 RepID=A0A1H8WAT7_9EURY|nr:hypothetical protein [Halogranum amylolyticum]SEP24775.1 hypothetical protein SAMN04487948_12626 [Halogranum amylolyticum]
MEDDEYHPTPLGFEKDDGFLIEGENSHDVVSVLEMVQKDELSKRKAARRLETLPSTINREFNRGELYGL